MTSRCHNQLMIPGSRPTQNNFLKHIFTHITTKAMTHQEQMGATYIGSLCVEFFCNLLCSFFQRCVKSLFNSSITRCKTFYDRLTFSKLRMCSSHQHKTSPYGWQRIVEHLMVIPLIGLIRSDYVCVISCGVLQLAHEPHPFPCKHHVLFLQQQFKFWWRSNFREHRYLFISM